MRIVNLALVASLFAAPVAAQTQPTSAAPAAAKDSKDPNRMVCRKVENTGSRLGSKKICRTAAEWAEVQAIERRDIERFQVGRSKNN